MARFTKALRTQIVEEFTSRHNGLFTPTLFIEEVRATGPDHPAYDWFDWDDTAAADKWRIYQARQFVSDLRIEYKIEVIRETGTFTVSTEVPQVLSPLRDRHKGGGYYVVHPGSEEHLSELAQQASMGLRQWLKRYEAVVLSVGEEIGDIVSLAERLEKAASKDAA